MADGGVSVELEETLFLERTEDPKTEAAPPSCG